MEPAGDHATPADRPPLRVGKIFLAAITLAIVAVGGALLLDSFSPRPGSEQQQTLPDGSTIALKAVLGGTNYTFSTKTFWDRFRENVPREFQSLVPRSRGYYEEQINGSNRTLCVFYDRQGGAISGGSSNFDYTAVLSDKSGWSSRLNNTNFIWPKYSTGGSLAIAYSKFDAFPPFARELTVSLYANSIADSDTSPVAQFHFQNPVLVPGTNALVTKLATLHANDSTLSVTLLRVVTKVDNAWTWESVRGKVSGSIVSALQPKRATRHPVTWMPFQVQEGNHLTTDWQIEGIKVTDATGTEFTNHASWQNGYKDFAAYAFEPPLWSGNGAFNLHVEFVRVAHRPADELWTLDVDVPTSNSLVPDGRSKVFDTMRVELAAVGGPASKSNLSGYSGTKHLLVEFWVTAASAANRRFQLVSAVDNLGRKLRSTGETTSFQGSKDLHSFGLQTEVMPLQDAASAQDASPTSVTVTVAAMRSHFLDLVVDPEAAK